MRIIHLSDIHVWRYTRQPRHLMSRRFLGILELLKGRAGKFRMERLEAVVERVVGLFPDHVLITGDLTTTALPAEFRDARRELAPLLADPTKVTAIPGNHDRTTHGAMRGRRFEEYFGDCLPAPSFPWLRPLDDDTAILGLDPTRPDISAKGQLPIAQLLEARSLIADSAMRPGRLILACHYPLAAPPDYTRELEKKRMRNDAAVRDWVATIGPHLYCCGHVHAAWAFTPETIPGQLCINAGAPLMRDPHGMRPPGFMEIILNGPDVTVSHHAWNGQDWAIRSLSQRPGFFNSSWIEAKPGNVREDHA